jgi:DNA-binding MarR family transcriptional regulator
MSITEDVWSVQRLYPKLYVACHSIHGRATATAPTWSATECAILSHLCVEPALSASLLAKHLGLARSTLSEFVSRLVDDGHLESHRDERDERRNRLVVTAAGLAAMSSVAVLDQTKLAAVLSRLTPGERARVIDGLALLAQAAVPVVPVFHQADKARNAVR